MLNDVIKFKVHVQTSLEGYEDFVAQEVDRECEEQEVAEAEERRLVEEEQGLYGDAADDVDATMDGYEE